MDIERIGGLIRELRQKAGLTQAELGRRLGVSDKAVSKWERGAGCPDLSLLPGISRELGADPGALLEAAPANAAAPRGIRTMSVFVCPKCCSVTLSSGSGEMVCCGMRLRALTASEPDDAHRLEVEVVDDERLVSSAHPMEKDHYVSFAAVLAGGRAELIRLWPEWNLEFRLPLRGRGSLLWYCTNHGLFKMKI